MPCRGETEIHDKIHLSACFEGFLELQERYPTALMPSSRDAPGCLAVLDKHVKITGTCTNPPAWEIEFAPRTERAKQHDESYGTLIISWLHQNGEHWSV